MKSDLTEEIAGLVARYRRAVESGLGVELPPLRPGLGAEERRRVEAELGFALPEELAALYSVADGGHVAYGEPFYSASRFRSATAHWEEMFWLVADIYADGIAPLGTAPVSHAIPIQSTDMQSLWVGAGGVDDDVIYAYHARPEPASDFSAWVVIASSLITYLRASVELAESGCLETLTVNTRVDILLDRTHPRLGQILQSYDIDQDLLW